MPYRNICWIMALLLLAAVTQAQTVVWSRVYARGGFNAVEPVPGFGSVLAGVMELDSNQGSFATLYATDLTGGLRWTHTIGNANTTTLYAVTVLNGRIYVAGVIAIDRVIHTYFLRKFSLEGDSLGELAMTGPADALAPYSLQTTPDGHLLVGSRFTALAKMDTLGQVAWAVWPDGEHYGWEQPLRAVAPLPQGGYVAAFNDWFDPGQGSVVAKIHIWWLSETGQIEDSITVDGGADLNSVYCLLPLSQTDVVIGGATNFEAGYGEEDAFVSRINRTGEVVWTRTWTGHSTNTVSGLHRAGDSLWVVISPGYLEWGNQVPSLVSVSAADGGMGTWIGVGGPSISFGNVSDVATDANGALWIAGSELRADVLGWYPFLLQVASATALTPHAAPASVNHTLQILPSASSQIRLMLPVDLRGVYDLRVYDILGREVGRLHGMSGVDRTVTMPLDCGSGKYFVKVTSSAGQWSGGFIHVH